MCECVCERERECECECVCVCLCERESVCVCVCVCVCERERECPVLLVFSRSVTRICYLCPKCHPKQFICPICVIQSCMMTLDAAAALMRPHLVLISRRFKAIFKARRGGV